MRILLFGLFLALSATPGVASPMQEPLSRIVAQSASATPTPLERSRLQVGGIRIGTSEQVVRRLGKPLSVTDEPNPNYRRVQRLIFPGITVLVADGFVTLVYTQDPKFATIDGIRVGDPKAKVLKTYGTTAEEKDGRTRLLRYTNDAEAAFLVFALENDRVKRITCGTLMD
jgi:hypothetical protein